MPNKTIYYDFNNQYAINDQGARITQNIAKIAYQEAPIFQVNVCTVSNSTLTAVDLSSATSWASAVNYLFNDASTDPMCRSLNASIDSSLAYDGIVKVQLDANTSTFIAALVNNTSHGINTVNRDGTLPVFFELRGYNGSGNVIYYISFSILAQGVLDPAGGTPPDPIGNWYTKAEVDGIVNGIVNGKIDEPVSSTYGDIIAKGTSTAWQAINIGTDGQILKVVSGYPAWSNDTIIQRFDFPGLPFSGAAASSELFELLSNEEIWYLPNAVLQDVKVQVRIDDSGATQSTVNIRIGSNASDTCSSDIAIAETVASGTVNSGYANIVPGDRLKILVKNTGTNKDAYDLSIWLKWRFV